MDYSKPDLQRFPKFQKLQANEVILTAGDFLYLPTHWFKALERKARTNPVAKKQQLADWDTAPSGSTGRQRIIWDMARCSDVLYPLSYPPSPLALYSEFTLYDLSRIDILEYPDLVFDLFVPN